MSFNHPTSHEVDTPVEEGDRGDDEDGGADIRVRRDVTEDERAADGDRMGERGTVCQGPQPPGEAVEGEEYAGEEEKGCDDQFEEIAEKIKAPAQ